MKEKFQHNIPRLPLLAKRYTQAPRMRDLDTSPRNTNEKIRVAPGKDYWSTRKQVYVQTIHIKMMATEPIRTTWMFP